MNLSSLPSVDSLLMTPEARHLLDRVPRALVVEALRQMLAEERQRLRRENDLPESSEALSPSALVSNASAWINQEFDPGIPKVVNATGVVLHTNLGRAPLAPQAIQALVEAARQPNALELDLATGTRGHRDSHVSQLISDLTGAESALAVNNNAAALLLALDTLATRREVLVSRGELIEIGGAFRLPDVLRRAGAILREVGTTNRTRIEDYASVLSRRTALILRAHPSNYRIEGFTGQPSRAALAELAHDHGIPFLEDLGSGALVDLAEFGAPHEPRVSEAIQAGVDLVTFSGDKLLGGPQAGLIAGRKALVDQIQKNPLKRALRLDKLSMAALRATLTLYRTSTNLGADIPTLGLLMRSEGDLEALAHEAAQSLRDRLVPEFQMEIVPSESEIGSGAQPTEKLPSLAIAIEREGWSPDRVAVFFRSASPAILGRITRGRFLLDLRAIESADELNAKFPGQDFHEQE